MVVTESLGTLYVILHVPIFTLECDECLDMFHQNMNKK